MRFLVVALPANALKIVPIQPQRVSNSSERFDMVNVHRRSIAAHLANRLSISFQPADSIPLLIISPLLVGPSGCITLGFAFCLPENSGCVCHRQTSSPYTNTCTPSASVLPVDFTNFTVIVLQPDPTVPPVNVKLTPLFAAMT